MDSSLSFLNRLSVGKAMANAPHSQVSSYKPSGCIEQLHAFSRGWPHGSYPKPHAPANHIYEPGWQTMGSASQTEPIKQGCLQLLQRLSFMYPPYYPSMCGIICDCKSSIIALSHSSHFFGNCVRNYQQRTTSLLYYSSPLGVQNGQSKRLEEDE